MIATLPALLARTPRWSALIAGLASACGFAPLNLWPVTLIALAVLMHLVRQTATHSRVGLPTGKATIKRVGLPTGKATIKRVGLPTGKATIKRAFLLGWLFGFGHFTLSLNWIATAFTFQSAMPPILGWFAVPLIAFYLALYPALACAAAWWLWRRVDAHQRPATFTLLFAAAWIISEWLRSWVFTGFAWNPLAVIAPWAAHPATLIGSYGQSGLVVLLAGTLWLIANRQRLDVWIPVSVSSGTIGVALLASFVIDETATIYGYGPQGDEATAITIVQPNIGQGDKWDMEQRIVNFERLAGLSRPPAPAPRGGSERATGPASPRLLLWPEAAVPDYLEDGTPADWAIEEPARVRARLAALLGPDDLLLTGAVRLESNVARSDITGARNAVFTLNARGQLGPRYDKAHLVPYGEYLPMRSLLEPLGLSRLAPGAVDFWPGPGARTLDLGRFGKAGVQICYEIIFSGQVVDRANRPDFIFNPSNDAWFGGWGPPQHLAQARLRAIEEGLPVVRSTPTGISAIIDADGRIVEALPMHAAGRIDAALPPPHAPTLFAQLGNILPLAFAVFLVGLGVAFGRRRA